MVIAGEIGDAVASCDCSGEAHRRHDGFGTRVAERGALHPSKFTNRLGKFSSDDGLRADFRSGAELLFNCLD